MRQSRVLYLDHTKSTGDVYCWFQIDLQVLSRFFEFQIFLMFSINSRYFQNTNIVVSNRFETKNKHRHWIQHTQLPPFRPGFRVITSQLAKIRSSRKTPSTLEGHNIDTSALDHFVEDPLGYLFSSLEVSIPIELQKTPMNSLED